MKKLFSAILALALAFSICSISAFAAESTPSNNMFFISSDDIASAAKYNSETGKTEIPIHVDLDEQYAAEILITITNGNTRASGVRNISLEGYFYLKADGTKVTAYGLAGSFEYTGTTTTITGSTSYHNATYGEWTGTHRTSTSTSDGSATLTGHYDVYKPSGVKDNSCQLTITVNKDGTYTLGGSYSDSNVS